jgi:hypothetical protein
VRACALGGRVWRVCVWSAQQRVCVRACVWCAGSACSMCTCLCVLGVCVCVCVAVCFSVCMRVRVWSVCTFCVRARVYVCLFARVCVRGVCVRVCV